MRKIGVGGVIEAGSDLSRNGDPSEMKILGFINFKKKNAVPEFEQREKKCFAKLCYTDRISLDSSANQFSADFSY